MNILYHHRTQGEGVERVHIMGIVEAWRQQGHNVDIIGPPGILLENIEKKNNIRKTKNNFWGKILFYTPEIFFEFMEVLYNFYAYFKISNKIKYKNYDLIFERYSFLCIAGLLISLKNKIPFYLEVNYTSETPIVRKRSYLTKKIEVLLEKIVFIKSTGIIVVSTFLKNSLIANKVNKNKIIVLPNAADPKKFSPKTKPAICKNDIGLHGKMIVGFIGYFYPWHGIELLIKTYFDISKEISNVAYVLVGNGPIYNDINTTIKQNNLENSILLAGKISHNAVPDYINMFDVAIMPHSNDYGSPMKILEYMAMEKAVIAPKLGPIEDIISNGENGMLFEPKNLYSLHSVLVKVLTDDQLREKLGKNARQTILTRNNWHFNAQKIINFYKKNNL